MFWTRAWLIPPRCCRFCSWLTCLLNMWRPATASGSPARFQPTAGAVFVPEACWAGVPSAAFSAITSTLRLVVTLGTLMAVFLATSDEAIPLLVSMPAYWDKLVLLMVLKVLYAIAVGFGLDFVLRKALPKGLRGGYTGRADEVDCHEEHDDAEGHHQPIWKAALRHTLEIFVFIFAFSLVFGLIVRGRGRGGLC